MPYATPMGQVYDTGEFAQNLEDGLLLSDMAGLPARKEAAKARGKLRGAGLATYIEACSGGGPEQATVQVNGDGKVVLMIGTQTNGQGHETAYKQILADRLGGAAGGCRGGPGRHRPRQLGLRHRRFPLRPGRRLGAGGGERPRW